MTAQLTQDLPFKLSVGEGEAGARSLSVRRVESDYRLPPFLTAQV
jgi:hypothetical protein